jgi:pimeloyl-ACP methyl ester carboxylesterase
LRNKIAAYSTINTTVSQVASETALPLTNGVKSVNGTTGLTKINSKFLNYHRIGTGPHHLVFVHGLGGTQDYYTPLISALALGDTYSAHVFDLEGHGLSPTHPLSVLSIESFAADIGGVFQHAGISVSNPGILFAQSMGCLAALKFALDEPSIVSKLVLIGPPPSPLPPAASKASYARAALVRAKGMAAVADAVVNAGASRNTKAKNPVAVAAVRLSLLGQDPESYAKACSALAGATKVLDVGALSAPTLIITGQEDNFSPPAICKKYAAAIKNTRYMVLKEVGQWPIFEALPEVTEAVKGFLSK